MSNDQQNPLTPSEPPQPSNQPPQYQPPQAPQAPQAPQYQAPPQAPGQPFAPPAAPPAPQQPYAPQGQPGQQGNRTNILAILSLVFAFVFSLAGIILGHMALSQIKKTGENGRGLALAGTILGYIFTGLGLLFLILYIAFFSWMFSAGLYY